MPVSVQIKFQGKNQHPTAILTDVQGRLDRLPPEARNQIRRAAVVATPIKTGRLRRSIKMVYGRKFIKIMWRTPYAVYVNGRGKSSGYVMRAMNAVRLELIRYWKFRQE